MAVSYEIARRFVGKPVMAHCRDGRRYYGIITRVTPECIHLRPVGQNFAMMSANSKAEISSADLSNHVDLEITETGYGWGPGYGYGPWYGYGPGYAAGIVLPLYALLALSLFWW